MKRFVTALSLALAACSPSAAQDDTWSPVEVTMTVLAVPEPVDGCRQTLAFELESPQARFGGLSDLHVFEDGRFLAIADSGEWFLAELTFSPETGLPSGLVNPRMALMRNEAGDPFPSKQTGDAEDLAVLPDGRIAVSFEQTQTIRIYDLFDAGPGAPAQAGPALTGTQLLNSNRGLEALAILPTGELLVGAERGRRTGDLPVWRVALDAAEPVAPTSWTSAPHGYGLTSFAVAEGHAERPQIWALQRFYAPGLGTRVRIMMGFLGTAPGELRLIEIGVVEAPNPVDNFEGVAINAPAGTSPRLYLLSDNNFSDDQRTLLILCDLELAL